MIQPNQAIFLRTILLRAGGIVKSLLSTSFGRHAVQDLLMYAVLSTAKKGPWFEQLMAIHLFVSSERAKRKELSLHNQRLWLTSASQLLSNILKASATLEISKTRLFSAEYGQQHFGYNCFDFPFFQVTTINSPGERTPNQTCPSTSFPHSNS